MNPTGSALSTRFIPLLTFLLLNTPLSYIGDIFHEEGHCFLAIAQGGTCTGIIIGQSESFALASSYLVSVGGWTGQYVLVAMVILLVWRIKPKSFLARSAVTVIVFQNLVNPPAYIASLQGDSAAVLSLLEGDGVGRTMSVVILESIAIILYSVGIYVSWRYVRRYFSDVFQWVNTRRTTAAAVLFVAVTAASTLFSYTSLGERMLLANAGVQAIAALTFLVIFAFLIIPPPPATWKGTEGLGPSRVTVAFVVLLFVEAQLIFFFVLPLAILFP
ncbi:MAG TPA: hypothetical protein VEJ19_03540 [Nitrososphaerales archaeon]|nr:hypothetical protein [Nitrososphaerales archaeon]